MSFKSQTFDETNLLWLEDQPSLNIPLSNGPNKTSVLLKLSINSLKLVEIGSQGLRKDTIFKKSAVTTANVDTEAVANHPENLAKIIYEVGYWKMPCSAFIAIEDLLR